MSEDSPVTVICKFVVKPGQQDAMRALLAKHWPTLHACGLTTDEPAQVFQGVPAAPEKEEAHGASTNVFVEIFSWKNARAPQVAHESPEVLAVWEPMGACCSHMEFPHFERVS